MCIQFKIRYHSKDEEFGISLSVSLTLQEALEYLVVRGRFGSTGVPKLKFLLQDQLKHSDGRSDNDLFSRAKTEIFNVSSP